MKKILLLCLISWSIGLTAQTHFSINHGPYLQEMLQDGVTVVFNTSHPSFSKVEIRENGNDTSSFYYETKHGLRNADTHFFAIRAEHLKAATTYQYRILAKEVKSFQPYKVVFGDSIVSPWYTFRTVDPKQKGGSLFITSDIHNRPDLLKNLLKQCDYQTCTSFFYAGDMMNYMEKNSQENPFTAFVDASVEMFATSVPFELVRGNHETRGNLARSFPDYFPKKNGKVYGHYLLGDIMVVMLDCGEDKADTHPVYAGFTDYSGYRLEQKKWLEDLLTSKEYKQAKYHIVICHFPLAMSDKEKKKNVFWGWQEMCDMFLPVLNKADVDLLVSGHTHRFFYHKPGSVGNKFPMIEQGAGTAARLDLVDGEILLRVIDDKGVVVFRKSLFVK